MAEFQTSTSSGIGFFGLLTVLFIGLKLTNYIDWSWWWVLGPLWIPTVAGVAIFLIVMASMVIFAFLLAVIGAIASLFVK